jgi:hypothetical protein
MPIAWAEPRSGSTGALEFSEKIVAGSPNDFLEVRHLTLRGSNFDIGKKLAEVARQQLGVRTGRSDDRLRTRAQREYFQRNAPIHFERMRGAAAAFGVDIKDDAYNLSSLTYGLALPGCSVVYYPPGTTADGVGVLSRNYDFTTGTIMGRVPEAGEVPCTSRPYVVEMYPDQGYASLAIVAYDLLGSVLDGVNSEGLAVALLADDELQELGKADPARGTQAGLEVIQVTRLLLDTCANVDDAKAALMSSRLYYSMIPCHYIVADGQGKSFIWENAPTMHYGTVVENDGAPLITTNFMHYLHPEARDPSKAKEPFKTCSRYDTLRGRIASASGKFTVDGIKVNNAAVMMQRAAPPAPRAANRTLWHSLYFPEQRRLEVDFYLRETPGTSPNDPPTMHRTGYLPFRLNKEGRASR